MESTTVGTISFESGFPSVVRLVQQETSPEKILANLEFEQRELARRLLAETGAVLFRGFNVLSIDEFEDVAGVCLASLRPTRAATLLATRKEALSTMLPGPTRRVP